MYLGESVDTLARPAHGGRGNARGLSAAEIARKRDRVIWTLAKVGYDTPLLAAIFGISERTVQRARERQGGAEVDE